MSIKETLVPGFETCFSLILKASNSPVLLIDQDHELDHLAHFDQSTLVDIGEN